MFKTLGPLLSTLLVGAFAVTPTSTNYTLKTYDFGNGGGTTSSSNYKLNSITGTQTGVGNKSSTTYTVSPGLPTQHANVPPAPTLTNPSGVEYSRLKLVLNNASNPTDTKFSIAISSDNFVTTQYVKNDNSITSTLAFANYQTYTAWGGGSGFYILGLTPATTYKVKVSAWQGNFSGSPYGPATSGVATGQPTISFSVATTLTSSPPLIIAFTNIAPSTVATPNADALISLSSNALSGGAIYLNDQFAGLKSTAATFTVNSATANLSVVSNGYGAQVIATGQSSGGPLASLAPYDFTSANAVGILSTALAPVASTPSPIVSGSATVRLKTKVDSITPSATDYADTLTFIAAMSF